MNRVTPHLECFCLTFIKTLSRHWYKSQWYDLAYRSRSLCRHSITKKVMTDPKSKHTTRHKQIKTQPSITKYLESATSWKKGTKDSKTQGNSEKNSQDIRLLLISYISSEMQEDIVITFLRFNLKIGNWTFNSWRKMWIGKLKCGLFKY